MIRRPLVLCLSLFAAACASSPPQRPAAPAPRQAVPPAPPRDVSRDYLGMSAAALRRQMGAPAFVRKDGALELWRYDGAACHAFFFLSDPPKSGDKSGDKGGDKTVRDVETLPQSAPGAADPGCLAALRRDPAKTS
jgi:hypothetical protein